MTSDDGRWRHLHPIALVVALIDSAKAAVTLILAMAAIALSKRDSPVVVATALVIIILLAAWMVIAPFARWRATTYLLDEDGVTLRSGVFNRKRVTIAYDRIHTVSSSMPFYMRPFDVVTLQATAAGSAEAGITLVAVPASMQTELEALRQQAGGPTAAASDLAAGIPGTAASTSIVDDSSADVSDFSPAVPIQGELVFRASTRDILLFAVTDLGMFAALLALIGIVDRARDVVPDEWMDVLGNTIARCRADDLSRIAARQPDPRMRAIRHDYEVDVLVPDRYEFARQFPDIPCDRMTIDDYMALTLKGSALQ